MNNEILHATYPFISQKELDWIDSNGYWTALDEFSRGYNLETQDEWAYMMDLFNEWMEGTYSGLLDDAALDD